jgi:hypothetical protein
MLGSHPKAFCLKLHIFENKNPSSQQLQYRRRPPGHSTIGFAGVLVAIGTGMARSILITRNVDTSVPPRAGSATNADFARTADRSYFLIASG